MVDALVNPCDMVPAAEHHLIPSSVEQGAVPTHLVTECGQLALQLPFLPQRLLFVLILLLKLYFHLF